MHLSDQDRARLSQVSALFADIDDTISTHGRITGRAFDALWRAHENGLPVVPVTGRPAGWCDHIARMWPVPGVIGENGGLYFRRTEAGMQRVFMDDEETRRAYRQRLGAIRDEILAKVPGAGIASDQFCREYDLAVDYCEDVPPLDREQVRRIVAVFESHGATAKVSSIHVNGWFGDFNKLAMVRRFVREVFGLPLDDAPERFAFVGDSPNDEPMFEAFGLSFGVANVRRFLADMAHHPTFVADAEAGAGFVEVVDAILAARAAAATRKATT
jgi:HAD superfamily hydrolase (TIGR01484 family)